MQEHAFEFGSAVTAAMLNAPGPDGRRYREFVRSHLTRAVFENDLKWGPWEAGASNSGDRYRRRWVAAAFDSLARWGIDVRGHYGIWGPMVGGSTPEDLTGDRIPDEDQPDEVRRAWLENLDERVGAVERIGRPTEWDAVNHPVGWGPRTSGEVAGLGLYADVFERMRDLAPRAELWLNEGGVLEGATIDSYAEVIRDLQDRGVRPDGIGVMGHLDGEELTPPERIYDRLDRLSGLVPRLQVTELDVTVESDTLQARYFRDVLTAAFSHPDVEGILLWGFWAGRHWRPAAALYRRDWSPEPAAAVFERLLFDRWWTESVGRTDGAGRYAVTGFTGRYRVRASRDGTAAVRTATLDTDGTRLILTLDVDG